MRERKSIYAGEATNAGSINGGWRRRRALADTTGGWRVPVVVELPPRPRERAVSAEPLPRPRERAIGAEKPSAQRSSFSLTHSIGYNT